MFDELFKYWSDSCFCHHHYYGIFQKPHDPSPNTLNVKKLKGTRSPIRSLYDTRLQPLSLARRYTLSIASNQGMIADMVAKKPPHNWSHSVRISQTTKLIRCPRLRLLLGRVWWCDV